MKPYRKAEYFTSSRERFSALTQKLEASATEHLDHSQIEVLIENEGREVLRQLFQDHLDLRVAREKKLESVTGSDGIERTHRRIQERTLRTIFGDVTIERMSYCAPEENTLRPMDAKLNLPRDRYSHQLVKRLVSNAVNMSFDAAIDSLEKSTGNRIPKRQAEYQLRLSSVGFRDFYNSRVAIPPRNSEDILVLSTDGKGVIMRYEDLRWETKLRVRNAPQNRHHLKSDDTPVAINRKRMATVAAVYSTSTNTRTPEDILGVTKPTSGDAGEKPSKENPPRPNDKRVWASLMFTPEEIIDEVFQEALRRDKEQKHRWVYLVDGDLSQLRRIRRSARKHKVKVDIVCDYIHVLEYLWDAAHCFYPQGSDNAEKWVMTKALEILRGKAGYVAAGMRRSATKRRLSAEKRKGVDVCARYLLNHRAYLKYDQYLAAGYPIASGVIEGTCRHLINDRLDITGARWSLYGAETLLRMRALWANGDLDEFFEYSRKRHFENEHLSHYRNGIPDAVKDAA